MPKFARVGPHFQWSLGVLSLPALARSLGLDGLGPRESGCSAVSDVSWVLSMHKHVHPGTFVPPDLFSFKKTKRSKLPPKPISVVGFRNHGYGKRGLQ